jgi:phosphoglycerate dehydrogenase-like enzyme
VLRMLEDKRDKRWPEDRFTRFTPVELRGSTVGIVGYGSVGREVARLCVHFGAKVLATKRDLKYLIDEGYMPEGLGDPRAELFERLYPPQALQSMVSMCDFVVITVPLTQETRGLIDKHVFSSMKPTAFLIDISRGGVVEHADLIEALQSEQIAGAVIDVFSKEPLPEESPLWEIPNVILSPHIAGASAHYQERAADLFLENLGRYMLGEPLLNRYHPQHGY